MTAAEPFVKAGRIEIAIQIAHGEVDHPERLRAVDDAEHAFLTREVAELAYGRHHAVGVVDVREQERPRALADRSGEQAEHLLRPGHRRRQVNLFHGHAAAARQHEPGTECGRMLAVRRDDLIARGQVESGGDEPERSAGAGGEVQFVGLAAHEGGRRGLRGGSSPSSTDLR